MELEAKLVGGRERQIEGGRLGSSTVEVGADIEKVEALNRLLEAVEGRDALVLQVAVERNVVDFRQRWHVDARHHDIDGVADLKLFSGKVVEVQILVSTEQTARSVVAVAKLRTVAKVVAVHLVGARRD